MKKTGCFAILFLMMAVPAFAGDLTLFGGFQRQGKITLNQIPRSSFGGGTFGIRVAKGKFWGHEETLAYTPNFIDTKSRAIILSSNFVMTVPLPVVKPYVTAGVGTFVVSGSGISDIGTKFAFNYGGGVKLLPAGPVGLRGDVRAYTLLGVQGDRLNVFEASLGLLFHF